jgi:hypothetical protein
MSKSDLVKQELESLAEANNGLLLPEIVVKYAKDPNTALHSSFEWNDTEAAHAYRLWQARQIITVVLTILPREGKREYQMFVSLKSDRSNGGGYRALVDVMSNDQQRKELLAQAYNDFKLWQKKYQQLKELAPVFEQMAEIMTKVT